MIFCARALRTKAIRNQQALLYKKKIFPKWLVGNAAIWVLILFHFITFVATRIRNLPQSTLTAPQICISTTAQDLSCCCWCTAAICHCNIKVHFLIARLTRSKDIGLAFLRAALLNARAQCRNRRRQALRAQCAFELKSAGAGKSAAPTRVRAMPKLVRVENVVVVILLFSSN